MQHFVQNGPPWERPTLGHGKSARREQQRGRDAMDREQPPLPAPWQCGARSSLGGKGAVGVFCSISDFPTALTMGSQPSKPSRSRGTTATALPPVRARPERRHGRRAGPPGGGPREGGQGPGAAGGRGLREGGPRSALRCAAERGCPADGVRLAGLRLRGAGGGGRCRGLRQGRWVLVAVAVPVVLAGRPRSAPPSPVPPPAVTPQVPQSPCCHQTSATKRCSQSTPQTPQPKP